MSSPSLPPCIAKEHREVDAALKPLYDVSIFVPCHFDYSQVEFVAPFLQRFGGTVFLYKWNSARQKMRDYYSDRLQYPHVAVEDFTLENLVRCILTEPRQVVLLLTASMAYDFGRYQYALLQKVRELLPHRVAAVNVVGHCMYGCMSCTGIEHKLPIYFTRFFTNRLPYSTADIRQRYLTPTSPNGHSNGNGNGNDMFGYDTGAVSVLVAPSTGSTSLIVQPTIVDLLTRLQNSGRYRFVWKLHPVAFNPCTFTELHQPEDVIEAQTLQRVFATFEVTDEQQPCLLPFLEAFDVVLCDLHSTVPFVTSYFAPKCILAFHNDVDYEATRDEEFLANVNAFKSVMELEQLFGTLPRPRGDAKFFHKQYGVPDGTEELKFAKASRWPLLSDRLAPLVCTVHETDLHQLLSAIMREWRPILEQAGFSRDGVQRAETEESRGDCANAIGLPWDWQPTERFFDGSTANGGVSIRQQMPTGSVLMTEAVVRVMTLNLWNAGERSGLPLDATASVLCRSGADVVGLQELHGLPDVTGQRHDRTEALFASLQRVATDAEWHLVAQGTPLPTATSNTATAIVSRWPVLQRSAGGWGCAVAVNGNRRLPLWVFNCHLPYAPYEPYQLLGIPYEGHGSLSTAHDAEELALRTRSQHIASLLADIRRSVPEGALLCVTGDFNEPSAHDWTDTTVLAGVHPCAVRWPTLQTLARECGLVDAFDCMRGADELARPGYTWSTQTAPTDPHDHHDRIDAVLIGTYQRTPPAASAAASVQYQCELMSAKVVGEDAGKGADVVITPWTSDHRAVLVECRLAAVQWP